MTNLEALRSSRTRQRALADQHHLDLEEHVFFQLAGKLLEATQKTALAKEYEAEFTTQRVQA